MEKTPHVLIGGRGANKFAEEQGIPILPPGTLVTHYARKSLEHFKKNSQAPTQIGESVVRNYILFTFL